MGRRECQQFLQVLGRHGVVQPRRRFPDGQWYSPLALEHSHACTLMHALSCMHSHACTLTFSTEIFSHLAFSTCLEIPQRGVVLVAVHKAGTDVQLTARNAPQTMYTLLGQAIALCLSSGLHIKHVLPNP